jgi:hypothetical protein
MKSNTLGIVLPLIAISLCDQTLLKPIIDRHFREQIALNWSKSLSSKFFFNYLTIYPDSTC